GSIGEGPAMPDEIPSERYRRLARECLEVAYSLPLGEGRTTLLEMAQVWLRLADDYRNSGPLLPPIEGERPARQQQQQVQPKEDSAEIKLSHSRTPPSH